MAQQTFWRENDKRFAPFTNRLPSQQMKQLRWCRRLRDLDIVLSREREKSFEPRAGMFRTHAFKSVRQQHDQTGQPVPFVFRAHNKLVEDDLRDVDEIAELRFPQNQTVRPIETVTVFKTERGVFAKRAVDDFHRRLFGGQMLQRRKRISIFVIVKNRVPMTERAARRVLS